jgi:hypothetical protein
MTMTGMVYKVFIQHSRIKNQSLDYLTEKKGLYCEMDLSFLRFNFKTIT